MTKKRVKKSAAVHDLSASAPSALEVTAPVTNVDEQPPERDWVWLGSGAFIVALSIFLRFVQLGLKPFHHDEGVNGFFLTTLFREGAYKYDPANYHGPTLYYISLAFAKIFGLQTIPLRVSMAIFGVLMVVMVLFLRRYIGRIGSLAAALFLALSPGMVFISRYFIHEIFFVFLSLAFVVAVLFYIEKRKAGVFAIAWLALILLVCFLPSTLNLASFLGGGSTTSVWLLRFGFFVLEAALVFVIIRMLLKWDAGRPIYFILAAACVALLFATKETAFITLGTMAIACVCVWIWRKIRLGELGTRKWLTFGMVLSGIGLLLALMFRNELADGYTGLSNFFFHPKRVAEPFPFYLIIFLLIASVAAWILFLSSRQAIETELVEPADLTWTNFRGALGQRTDLILVLVAGTTIFIYLSILFFSSFFTYSEGISKAFEAYAIWTKTGSKDHTQNGLFAYLKWGMKVEAPIVIISLLGTLIAMMKGRHRFAMFAGLWAFGLFAAYSIIPYKTPWLALSFLLPMCISAGYAINELARAEDKKLKIMAAVLAVSGGLVLTYQTYLHNFVRYDDGEMTYVYAHTHRGFLTMVEQIDKYAQKSGKGTDATVEIVSPDYWPLTWYLNDYSKANFHGALVEASTSELIVAKKDAQDAAVIQKYATHYKYLDVYPLRPGVNLILLVRKDLAEPDAKDLYKITEYKKIANYTE